MKDAWETHIEEFLNTDEKQRSNWYFICPNLSYLLNAILA